MSCCGGNRARAAMPGKASSSPSPVPRPGYVPPSTVAVFRYEGAGSLTIIGPVTGRKYWFEQNGSELAVDPRDRAAVAKVPNVRLMRLA